MYFLFTEEGHKKFYNAVQHVVTEFEDHGLFEVKLLTIDICDIKEDEIDYKDEYQIAVLELILEKYRKRDEK